MINELWALLLHNMLYPVLELSAVTLVSVEYSIMLIFDFSSSNAPFVGFLITNCVCNLFSTFSKIVMFDWFIFVTINFLIN